MKSASSKETTQSYRHPEELEHEIFFSNTNINDFYQIPWESKRKGRLTFTGKGEEFSSEGWFPVFISKEELKKSGISLSNARKAFRDIVENK